MRNIRGLIARLPKRVVVGLTVALLTVAALLAWERQPSRRSPQALRLATADRGEIVLTVGGIGRIVEARASNPIAVAAVASPGATAAASVGSSTAPAGAVFPLASGRVSKLFVVPGRHVVAGQPLARLDDRGVAAAALTQARTDLASALVELRQKRTNDPLRGIPATHAELASGRLAVAAAKQRLAQLVGAPRPADVSAAQLELKRAEADLEALRGGVPVARAGAVQLARRAVRLADDRLARALVPALPADVAAADLEIAKAVAELAALQRPAPAAAPAAISAAQQAIDAARLKLAALQSSGDPAAISAATAEVKKAEADLAALTAPPVPPAPEAVAAAQQAVAAARLKRNTLIEPIRAEVAAARLELARARADLATLTRGPSNAAEAAAKQAVASARVKLTQLIGPRLPADVAAAQLEEQRARAELAVLIARGGPASRSEIALARLRVGPGRARLATARLALQSLTVRAVSAGTVTAVLAVPGTPVDSSTPIATVADLDHLAVSVDLSEFDVARVKRGQTAIVRVDALGGKPYQGTVAFAALTGTDNGGVVTYPVRVTLARPGSMRPGMNVSVSIVLERRRGVIRVPLQAVRRDGERGTVAVVSAAGAPADRQVTLGLADNKQIEIVRGLAAGQRVVLGGGS